MSRALQYSAADILRQLFIDLGVGTLPTDNGDWPISAGGEPTKPDNAITIYDTLGSSEGRDMITGEPQGHFGFQVRVRATDYATGWAKAMSVWSTLGTIIYDSVVDMPNESYNVHCAAGIGDPISLGKEIGAGKGRSLFTINAKASIVTHFPIKRPGCPVKINASSDQAANLTVWYPMECDGSNRIYDVISPARNNESLTAGAQSLVSDKLFRTVESFSGLENYATPTTGNGCGASLTAATPFTVSFWMNPNSALGFAYYIVGKQSFGSQGWSIYHYSQPGHAFKVNFSMHDAAFHFLSFTGPDTLPGVVDGQWWLITFTWDGASFLGYINGAVVTPSQLIQNTLTAPDYTGFPISIAPTGIGDSPYVGLLADFRVYEGRALTAAQVAAMYDPATRWDLYA